MHEHFDKGCDLRWSYDSEIEGFKPSIFCPRNNYKAYNRNYKGGNSMIDTFMVLVMLCGLVLFGLWW